MIYIFLYCSLLLWFSIICLHPQQYDVAKTIYEKGCIEAAEEWFDRNLLLVASGAVCAGFAQVLKAPLKLF